MKIAIMPGFSELIIKVNPGGEVTRDGLLSIVMPWLYAPWPEAQETGLAEMNVEGDTLRDLLAELGVQYKKAGVDFEPIDSKTNDVDFDYEVFINGKDYVDLPRGIDGKLKADDEVKVKVFWRWDG